MQVRQADGQALPHNTFRAEDSAAQNRSEGKGPIEQRCSSHPGLGRTPRASPRFDSGARGAGPRQRRVEPAAGPPQVVNATDLALSQAQRMLEYQEQAYEARQMQVLLARQMQVRSVALKVEYIWVLTLVQRMHK